MKTSNELDEIAPAFHDAQKEIETRIERNAEANGGSFSYEYTTLDKLIDHVKSVLSEHDLSFAQSTETINGQAHLVTTVMHNSGQWLRSETPLLVSDNDMQGLGSAITYARRYGLSSLLGVASEQDDDGASASRSSKKKGSGGGGQISDKQKGFLEGLCKDKVYPEQDLYDAAAIKQYLLNKAEVESIDNLSSAQASQLIEKMTELPDQEDQ